MFLDLLEKLKSSNAIIIERICYSVSILMAVGIISHWETCVEDVIQYAKLSKENCYLALIILQNIMKELNELQIAGKKMLRIKDILIEKLQCISDFIVLLLESFCAIKGNLLVPKSFEAKFLNQTLDLIHSWIKLDLNILKNQKLLSPLFLCFNISNCELICEIFSESICLSKSGKKYYLHSEYEVDVLLEKSDPLEIESIEIISEFLNVFISESILGNAVSEDNRIKKLLNANGNNPNAFASTTKLKSDEKLSALLSFANVFASIFEFYPNLLFTKNTLASSLLNSLYFFLAHKNRKISARMFMAFNEIKEFINRGYKLSNYSLPEKKEFCDFLIKICESIMCNCKLSDLAVPALMQGKVLNDIDDIEICDPNDASNFDNNELSIAEYRKQSEEIFYDLFMVFLSNFEEEGVSYFFSFLYGVLDNASISNLHALPPNDPKVFVIEVVLLLINSIISCFEVADLYAKFLVDFARKVIYSGLAASEKLLCPFLKFMDAASPYVHKDSALYSQSVRLFTEILKIKQIENLAGTILVQITEFAKAPSKENFEYLYKIFLEEYDNLSPKTLGNLVESLANTISVKGSEQEKEEETNQSLNEISTHYKLILGAASQRAEKAFFIFAENLSALGVNAQSISFVQNPALAANELNCGLNPAVAETFKMQFLRDFNVYSLLLKKAFFSSNKVLIEIFHEVMRQSANIIDKSLRFYVKDVNYVKEVTKIFNKLATNISVEILPYFDFINELMLFLYANNPDNFYVLSVLKPLYSNAAVNSAEKKDFIANNFVELSELIKKNIIEVNKNNKLDVIILLCYLWTTVLNAVDRLKIPDENVVYCFIDFLLDAFKSVSEPSLNKAILSLLSNLVSLPNIIPSPLVLGKFRDIVYAVYGSLDNLVGGVLTQVSFKKYKNLFFFRLD